MYVPRVYCTSRLTFHVSSGTGTQDFAPYLSVNAGTLSSCEARHRDTTDHAFYLALDFRAWLGGEHKINEYCHATALAGGARLAEILGTDVMDATGEITRNMVNVRLPLSGAVPYTQEVGAIVNRELLMTWKTYAAFFKHNDRWWTRCSVQVWTEVRPSLCGEIRSGNSWHRLS